MWSDRTDAGFIERPLGFHEGKKEVLAGAHYYHHVAAGRSDRIDARLGGGTVYLHLILGTPAPQAGSGLRLTSCEDLFNLSERRKGFSWRALRPSGEPSLA